MPEGHKREVSRDDVPRGHMTTEEDGVREFHCMIDDGTVAVLDGNELDVNHCPICGVPFRRASLPERIERRFPSLLLTAGFFAASLLMYATSKVIPVKYGTETVATGDITALSIGLFFIVCIGLASISNWVGGVVAYE